MERLQKVDCEWEAGALQLIWSFVDVKSQKNLSENVSFCLMVAVQAVVSSVVSYEHLAR